MGILFLFVYISVWYIYVVLLSGLLYVYIFYLVCYLGFYYEENKVFGINIF